MPVTREDVRYAYRFILGREPENEAVLDEQANFANLDSLRDHFMNSEEYRQSIRPAESTKGAYIYDAAGDVEVDASAIDRQAMIDRIGEAWAKFGETEPHWSVLVDDSFLHENISANIERFYNAGRDDISNLVSFADRAGADLSPTARVLDFGCGVGRLTFALAERYGQVTGVDISPGHLRLARERATEKHIANVRFDQLKTVDDLALYRGEMDFVVSLIVLQHNPPPIMAALLEGLLRTLAPGGVAVLQLPTFMPEQQFKISDYLANEQEQMEMNALPQRFVFEIIERCGCRPLEVREDHCIGTFPGISQTFAIGRI